MNKLASLILRRSHSPSELPLKSVCFYAPVAPSNPSLRPDSRGLLRGKTHIQPPGVPERQSVNPVCNGVKPRKGNAQKPQRAAPAGPCELRSPAGNDRPTDRPTDGDSPPPDARARADAVLHPASSSKQQPTTDHPTNRSVSRLDPIKLRPNRGGGVACEGGGGGGEREGGGEVRRTRPLRSEPGRAALSSAREVRSNPHRSSGAAASSPPSGAGPSGCGRRVGGKRRANRLSPPPLKGAETHCASTQPPRHSAEARPREVHGSGGGG